MEKNVAVASGPAWHATLDGGIPLASLTPAQTDGMLAAGWTRNGRSARTFTGIRLYGDWYGCVMLRLPLHGFSWKKRLRKLLRRNERHFKWDVGPYRPEDAERLALWRRFKSEVHSWMSPPDLDQHILRGAAPEDFHTWELTVREAGRLVAFSIFDHGSRSIASLEAAYDPGFHRFSPGLYTMLLEIDYAQAAGMDYYYPGFLPRNFPDSMFEYKLRPGNLEFFRVADQSWRPTDQLEEKDWLFHAVRDRLWSVRPGLAAIGRSGTLVVPQYPLPTFFPRPDIANYLLFLEIVGQDSAATRHLLTWDPLDRLYRLFPAAGYPEEFLVPAPYDGPDQPRIPVLPTADFDDPAELARCLSAL